MLGLVAVALVLLQGFHPTHALGADPERFISRTHRVRMLYPGDWTIEMDDHKRPPKTKWPRVNDWNADQVFKVSQKQGLETAQFLLWRCDHNQDYLNSKWIKHQRSGAPIDELPSTFSCGGGDYFVYIGDRPVFVEFTMMVTGIPINAEDAHYHENPYRNWQARALFDDNSGTCYAFQVDLAEPWQSKDPSTLHVEDRMRTLYPMFVEMLESIKFL